MTGSSPNDKHPFDTSLEICDLLHFLGLACWDHHHKVSAQRGRERTKLCNPRNFVEKLPLRPLWDAHPIFRLLPTIDRTFGIFDTVSFGIRALNTVDCTADVADRILAFVICAIVTCFWFQLLLTNWKLPKLNKVQ